MLGRVAIVREIVIDTETTGLDPLRRRLIYKIRGDGQKPIIMTMSRAMGE